jgi:hypothetical protein
LVFETQIKTFKFLSQNSSLEEISGNTLNRFSVCEIKTFIEGFYFSKTSFKMIFQKYLGYSKGEVLEINPGLYTFPNGPFGKDVLK